MRLLKRGVRGEDVMQWQAFLLQIRARRDLRVNMPPLRVDRMFGRETQRATVSFQQRFGLRTDGIVGARTLAQAETLGFDDAKKPLAGIPAGATVRASEALPPPPPSPAVGNTREVSLQRLRAEGWKTNGAVQAGLVGAKAVLQSVADGSGDYLYDEYSILVEAMPPERTPEPFLLEMATDLNGTVKDKGLDAINVFKRRSRGKSTVGEVIDIDILGPEDGSVMLVELKSNYFVFQTIDCDETGSHPDNGSREFGFERVGNVIRFYTRGVSRPDNFMIGVVGAVPQRTGWTRLMQGITDIVARGGRPRSGSLQIFMQKKTN